MELPTFEKTVNGHEMSIHFHSGQGGELEEAVWWCHTCDPEGKNCDVRETDYEGLHDTVSQLFNVAEAHAA
jgi:hypothetical protein